MGFPTIAGKVHSSASSDSPTYQLPAGIESNDGLLLFISSRQSDMVVNDWDTFTFLGVSASGSSASSLHVGYRAAVAGDTDVSPSLSDSAESGAMALRIARNSIEPFDLVPPEIAVHTPEPPPGTSHQPPVLSPSWPVDKVLWLAASSVNSTSIRFSGWPAAYTVEYANAESFSSLAQTLSSRELQIATEQPGPITVTGSMIVPLMTVAVLGGTGVGGGSGWGSVRF